MKKILMYLLILISLFSMAYSVVDLLPLQGTVLNSSGSPITLGNIQVVIYDDATAGNLIYNSTTDFNSKIINGQYDILIGSGSVDLTLEYGKIYYMDILIDSEDIDFNGNERQMFQSSVGEIKKTSNSNSALNSYNFAGGEETNSSGFGSVAWGFRTISGNDKTMAWGIYTSALNDRDTAWGANTIANGSDSTAFGSFTIASNRYSTAWGSQTTASGEASTAIGTSTTASGANSFAGGQASQVTGTDSFTYGSGMGVYGDDSFGFGRMSSLNGHDSFLIGGYGSTLNGNHSGLIGSSININGDNIIGISLRDGENSTIYNNKIDFNQPNTFAVVGGNSGFGTTSPQATVDINGNMKLQNTDNQYSLTVIGNNTNYFTIGVDGKVKIGETATPPQATLELFDITETGLLLYNDVGGYSWVSIGGGNSDMAHLYLRSEQDTVLYFSNNNNTIQWQLQPSFEGKPGFSIVNAFNVSGGAKLFVSDEGELRINDVMKIEPRSSAPSNPTLGNVYVDSDSNELCFYDGSSWTGLKAGGSCD